MNNETKLQENNLRRFLKNGHSVVHFLGPLVNVYFAIQTPIMWANKKINKINQNQIGFNSFGDFGKIFFLISFINIICLTLIAFGKDNW